MCVLKPIKNIFKLHYSIKNILFTKKERPMVFFRVYSTFPVGKSGLNNY
jgi:hypothetical protein